MLGLVWLFVRVDSFGFDFDCVVFVGYGFGG